MCHSIYVEVTVDFFLPPYWSSGSITDYLSWQQVPLPHDLSQQHKSNSLCMGKQHSIFYIFFIDLSNDRHLD